MRKTETIVYSFIAKVIIPIQIFILYFPESSSSFNSYYDVKIPMIQNKIIHHSSQSSTQLFHAKNNIGESSSEDATFTRRQSAKIAIQTLPILSLLFSSTSTKASAACLSGDVSPTCIGVYKVPLDDDILHYVSSPEKLAQFAPDIKFVPPVSLPKDYEQAIKDVQSCETDIVENLHAHVLNGKLEEAGIVVLSIVPKLTMAGRVIVDTLEQHSSPAALEDSSNVIFASSSASTTNDLSMTSFRVESNLSSLLGSLQGLDIYLGQGLRGQMGVLTAAQIQLLPDVQDVIENYNDLKRSIPDIYRPPKQMNNKSIES